MRDEIQVDEKLVEAFHLMFDHFPEAVLQLAHKSRRIVALNPAGKALGREVGMNCAKHGAPEAHRGCLATQAISEHQAKWVQAGAPSPQGNRPVVFWLPVDGYPDFFVHFGVGYSQNYVESL